MIRHPLQHKLSAVGVNASRYLNNCVRFAERFRWQISQAWSAAAREPFDERAVTCVRHHPHLEILRSWP
jgi:hypothetical protein